MSDHIQRNSKTIIYLLTILFNDKYFLVDYTN